MTNTAYKKIVVHRYKFTLWIDSAEHEFMADVCGDGFATVCTEPEGDHLLDFNFGYPFPAQPENIAKWHRIIRRVVETYFLGFRRGVVYGKRKMRREIIKALGLE